MPGHRAGCARSAGGYAEDVGTPEGFRFQLGKGWEGTRMAASQREARWEEGLELWEVKGGQSLQPSPGPEATMVAVDSGSGSMGSTLVVGSVLF